MDRAYEGNERLELALNLGFIASFHPLNPSLPGSTTVR